MLLGVEVNPIDHSSDNDSEASESSTCTSSPPSKRFGLPVPSTSKTILPEQEEPTESSTTFDDLHSSGIISESVDGTSFEVSVSEIHADADPNPEPNTTNQESSSVDPATTATTDSNSDALKSPPPTSIIAPNTKDSNHPKIKHSVGFEPFSTLYVFNDNDDSEEDDYDVRNAWYSVQDLKSFRADAFLTVNWMVMKGVDNSSTGPNEPPKEEPRSPRTLRDHRYYHKRYSCESQKEQKKVHEATETGYEFCERGVECRTPLGRMAKNKRRLDAMRVVLLYQQMQRQHRRERRRELRRQKQQQNRSEQAMNNKKLLTSCIRTPAADPEAVRQIEANIDAEALANVYGTYCEDSLFEAFVMGQSDASAVGMPSVEADLLQDDTDESSSSSETGQEASLQGHPLGQTSPTASYFQKNEVVNCPSLCDEDEDDDDEFMDNLISLSFVEHSDDNENDSDSSVSDEEESLSPDPSGPVFESQRTEGSLIRGTADDNDSFGSDSSVSLADLFFEEHKRNSLQEQASESEFEVELIEGNDEQPHKIYCSSERPSSTDQLTNNVRRNSWSHRESLSKKSPRELQRSSLEGIFSAAAFWRR